MRLKSVVAAVAVAGVAVAGCGGDYTVAEACRDFYGPATQPMVGHTMDPQSLRVAAGNVHHIADRLGDNPAARDFESAADVLDRASHLLDHPAKMDLLTLAALYKQVEQAGQAIDRRCAAGGTHI